MSKSNVKNAYMIMAHNNWKQLKILIRLLDDENNDFYIHIDKSVKIPDIPDIPDIKKQARYSDIIFTNRIRVKWGGYGTIDASMILLEEAVKKGYDYYHLMSASDLPLKSNEEINKFLKEHMYDNDSRNRMTNYLSYGLVENEMVRARVSHYNLLVPLFRTTPKFIGLMFKKFNALGYHVQKFLHVDRLKKTEMVLYKGSLWYIITNECAKFFLNNRGEGKKYFGRMTFSGDEYVLQTLLMNSELKYTVFNSNNNGMNGNLYEIDWNNTYGDGSPHLYTIRDKDLLEKSMNLYARKFDIRVDSKIVESIVQKHGGKVDINEKE